MITTVKCVHFRNTVQKAVVRLSANQWAVAASEKERTHQLGASKEHRGTVMKQSRKYDTTVVEHSRQCVAAKRHFSLFEGHICYLS